MVFGKAWGRRDGAALWWSQQPGAMGIFSSACCPTSSRAHGSIIPDSKVDSILTKHSSMHPNLSGVALRGKVRGDQLISTCLSFPPKPCCLWPALRLPRAFTHANCFKSAGVLKTSPSVLLEPRMKDQMVHDLTKPPAIFCLLFSYKHIALGKIQGLVSRTQTLLHVQ